MTRVVKKADVRRKEIIAAARRLFLETGYQSSSMQTLMERLKIAKGTIYHYFASKEELLEAVVEDLIDEDLRKKSALIETPDFKQLDALGKLRALTRANTMARENEKILDELHRPGNTVVHARQLGRYLTLLAPYYGEIIAEGVEQGIFKSAHPLECAEFLLAGIQFITDVGFYPWTEEDLVRRAAALPSLVEAHLGAPEGSFRFLVEP